MWEKNQDIYFLPLWCQYFFVHGDVGTATKVEAPMWVNINASLTKSTFDTLLNIHVDSLCLQRSLFPVRMQRSGWFRAVISPTCWTKQCRPDVAVQQKRGVQSQPPMGLTVSRECKSISQTASPPFMYVSEGIYHYSVRRIIPGRWGTGTI